MKLTQLNCNGVEIVVLFINKLSSFPFLQLTHHTLTVPNHQTMRLTFKVLVIEQKACVHQYDPSIKPYQHKYQENPELVLAVNAYPLN